MAQKNFLDLIGLSTFLDNLKTLFDVKPEQITWEAYQALTDSQRAGRHFKITGAPTSGLTAGVVSYDNTSSGLSATDVQDAIDEIAAELGSEVGIGTCNSKQPMSNAYLVVPNAGFEMKTGSYLAVIFSTNFYYSGLGLQIAIGSSLYSVRVNGEAVTDSRILVKSGDAGIFVYDGTYLQLIRTAGGGHTILDQDGTSMSQESSMQFVDAFLSDDSVGGKTVVENIKSVASADYSSETEDGMYLIPDGEGAVIEPASDDYVEVVADGEKTYQTLMNELYDNPKFDVTKINVNSYIFDGAHFYRFVCPVYWSDVSGGYAFSLTAGNATFTDIETIILHDTNSQFNRWENGTLTPLSAYAPPQNQVFKLYYGNKKATVDLQTTANRCWMGDGVTTVEQAINKGSVSVTADGNKTYDTLFAELHNLIDSTKITIHSVLQVNKNNYRIWVIDGSDLYFTAPTTLSSSPYVSVTEIALSWGGNAFTVAKAGTGADNNLSLKPSNGTKITLYY